MDIEPKVIYKVFSQGTYLGLLPTPRSPFGYSQDINTGATELVLRILQTLDNAAEDVEPITDESDVPLLTEDNEVITTERAADIVGVSGSGALIANGNDLEAWGFSDESPNGKLLFAGYITRWRGIIGVNSELEVTVTSYGKDLIDYVFGNGTYTLEAEQITWSDENGLHRPDQSSSQVPYLGQGLVGSFIVSKIVLSLVLGDRDGIQPTPASAIVTVILYSGTPNGANTQVGSASVFITNTDFQDIEFILSAPGDLSSGPHWFSVQANDYVKIRFRDATVYPGGSFFGSYDLTDWGDFGDSLALLFKLYSGGLETNAVFAATDPSDMIRAAIDGYRSQGGLVMYTDDSIDDTGLSLDYEFRTATVAEIIAKARELAPSNWFWYVDPATQVFYFKESG